MEYYTIGVQCLPVFHFIRYITRKRKVAPNYVASPRGGWIFQEKILSGGSVGENRANIGTTRGATDLTLRVRAKGPFLWGTDLGWMYDTSYRWNRDIARSRVMIVTPKSTSIQPGFHEREKKTKEKSFLLFMASRLHFDPPLKGPYGVLSGHNWGFVPPGLSLSVSPSGGWLRSNSEKT